MFRLSCYACIITKMQRPVSQLCVITNTLAASGQLRCLEWCMPMPHMIGLVLFTLSAVPYFPTYSFLPKLETFLISQNSLWWVVDYGKLFVVHILLSCISCWQLFIDLGVSPSLLKLKVVVLRAAWVQRQRPASNTTVRTVQVCGARLYSYLCACSHTCVHGRWGGRRASKLILNSGSGSSIISMIGVCVREQDLERCKWTCAY